MNLTIPICSLFLSFFNKLSNKIFFNKKHKTLNITIICSTDSSGDWYEGHFANGRREGKGAYTWSNGCWYEGDWVNGMRHGQGKEYLPNGQLIYEGTFRNDKKTIESRKQE